MSESNQNSSATMETVKLLKQTIVQLEGVISQLEVKENPILPSLDSCQQLLIAAQNLAVSSETTELSGVIEESEATPPVEELLPEPTKEPPYPRKVEEIEDEELWLAADLSLDEFKATPERGGLDEILPSLGKVEQWWDQVLLKIRAYLPSKVSDQISDWGLTGIISSLIVVILLTSVVLFPNQNNPAPTLSPQPDSVLETSPPPGQTPLPETIATPPELKEPKQPLPIKIVEPPQPKLTPEQKLIAGIKNQVASLTNQYEDGLILTIKADFPHSRLEVIVTEKWQDLTLSNQQKLSNKMLNKAEFLDFKKLEIFNQNGELLARSPVVGHNMIILNS